MGSGRYRTSWAEVDLESIKYNIRQIKETLNKRNKIMAVVKANGYGHGAVEVAEAAIEAGAEALAVALLEEAEQLREAGIGKPILVLGRVLPEFAPVAAMNGITLTVFQKEWIEEAERHLEEAGSASLDVHLKLDTGMHRTGITNETDLISCLEELKRSSRIYLSGAYTHFATADEAEQSYYNIQTERFDEMAKTMKMHWPEQVAWHSCNSAAALQHPEAASDFVRYGVSMYGLYPSPHVAKASSIGLRQAFSLHSCLLEVKQVKKGDTISYGQTYTAAEDEWIGTVPLGYADGWLRKLQGAQVLIEGRRMPIVGRICMDQFMVRLDGPCAIGEKVTLIGRQGEEEIAMQEIADRLDTIVYEVPCTISCRVPRVYV